MNRECGLYWVKYQGSWTIGEWHKDCWGLLGSDELYDDNDMDEIQPNKLETPTP